MKNRTLVLYIHGKGGTAQEAEHYKLLFPYCNVVGLDYKAETPWEAKAEFPAAVEVLAEGYNRVILIANSIGAFFSMCALPQEKIEKAYFISPIVDMEKLIGNMMAWANVSEVELREKGNIETAFGETLSWEYLSYVRSHPIQWTVPTEILYGGQDNLTDLETTTAFANIHGASLTVMENGEHWFHTVEQMKFLDHWIREKEWIPWKKSRFHSARKWLIFWTLFVGIGAVWGAACMLTDPTGKLLQMDAMLLYFKKLPFADVLFGDYTFSGIALLIVNGLTNLAAAGLLLAKKKSGVVLGGVFGVTLMLWIGIQFYMFPANVLSTVYFIFGFAQATTGYAAWVFGKEE